MTKKYVVVLLLGIGLLSSVTLAQSPLDDLRKRAEEALGKKRGPTDDRIAAGLKEALTVSTRKAVASTGRVDGFLKNAAIKILLPEKLRNVGKGMRLMGMGQQVDALGNRNEPRRRASRTRRPANLYRCCNKDDNRRRTPDPFRWRHGSD